MGENHKYAELRDKIMKGLKLAMERLIEQTIANDGYLVFGKNGKPVKVKAKNLKTI